MKFFNAIKEKLKQKNQKGRGLLENPLFYFGLFSVILLFVICFNGDSLADFNSLKNSDVVFFNNFFKDVKAKEKDDLFLNKNEILALEAPDLKIIEDNSVSGIAPPRVLTSKVLGDIFGQSTQNTDIIEYTVQAGDTLESIAQSFNISLNTILWVNDMAKGSKIKIGQTLVILPVSGLTHVVKSGDTVSEIAKTYKSKTDDIVAFNSLSDPSDIYIGDILIVPGGTMPKKAPTKVDVPLADSFFIFPAEGHLTQGIHWYNAVDIANKCGTPFYAAASGTVQRVSYGWNSGGGNYITILHTGGVVTYYGHFMASFVKPGDKVSVGDKVGLVGGGKGMAGAGLSTGCHLHFDVRGAKNPLRNYGLGSTINYK